jgi:ribosomal protein S14
MIRAKTGQAGEEALFGEPASRAGRRKPEMNESCDRCGPPVGAVYRVHRQGELYLCRLCASRLWPSLSAQSWTIWPVNELALAPQAA